VIVGRAKLVIARSNEIEANSVSGTALAFDPISAMRARSFDQPQDQRKKKK
jgi:hypothetical protein